MPRQLARLLIARSVPAWLAFVAAVPAIAAAPTNASDAALHDLTFVDAQTGWAVGDRGTILHTSDGGRHWRQQASGVDRTLHAVQFMSPLEGWAAGGYHPAYSRRSAGVLLRTTDGGQAWKPLPQPLAPELTAIRFFNANEGWALTGPSPIFAANLLKTDDGGRTWAPVVAADGQHWTAADFVNPRLGALAGARGELRLVRRGTIEPAEAPALEMKRVHAVRLAPDASGWLAGDAGLLLATRDSGRRWQAVPTGLPAQFDGRAIAIHQSQLWIAGSPGSVIWYSSDAGQNWTAQPTGSNVPIHALEFVDELHGWAAGSLGTILHTADGGLTWQRQHGSAARAAWLAVFTTAADVPLELFASLSADEGYLGVADLVGRADLEPSSGYGATSAWQARAALLAAGASEVQTAAQFPVRQQSLMLSAEQVLAGWDRANAGRGLAALDEHLVTQFRTWRPDVIVTDTALGGQPNPLTRLISQAVLDAAQHAADENSYVQLQSQLGLKPWRVQKLFGYLPAGQPGTLTVSAGELVSARGGALADIADRARAVLDQPPANAEAKLGFQSLLDHTSQGAGGHDFFSGIALQPGGEARRATAVADGRPDELLRRAAERMRNLQAIIHYMQRKSMTHDRLLAELGQLVADLEPDQAAELFLKMRRQFAMQGRWDLAFELANLLVDRYPDHPLAEPTLVWMLQAATSSELAAHAGQQSTRPAATPMPAPTAEAASEAPADTSAATAVNPAEQPLALARLLGEHWPAAFADPTVQFPLAAMLRRQPPAGGADKLYRNFISIRPHDTWWSCAAAQLWLREPRDDCPKPIWHVSAAASKPRLDGRLDDATWQKAEAIELASALGDDGDWPARALVAVDDEFLYLAAECREAPGCRYDKASTPRQRDPELSEHDRIEFYLDLDCDWVTYFRLVIDHRGWAAEDCWGDRTWDPRWFVAADRQAGGWTFEAAVPLEALGEKRPAAKGTWAVGVQRVVPQVGFQSWSRPAAVRPIPEGFGLMMFQ